MGLAGCIMVGEGARGERGAVGGTNGATGGSREARGGKAAPPGMAGFTKRSLARRVCNKRLIQLVFMLWPHYRATAKYSHRVTWTGETTLDGNTQR